jgi:hypothetical protein
MQQIKPAREHWELPIWRLWGQFPQFVNRAMVDQLRGHADLYVECVSSRGSPQRIMDSTGNFYWDKYYPSAEMHEDAASLLLPAYRSLLDREIQAIRHPPIDSLARE